MENKKDAIVHISLSVMFEYNSKQITEEEAKALIVQEASFDATMNEEAFIIEINDVRVNGIVEEL